MIALPLLHDVLRGLVLLLHLIAFASAAFALYAWREERAPIGTTLVLAALVVLGFILTAGTSRSTHEGSSWQEWLSLLRDAALPLLVLSLLETLRRRREAAEAAARASPFHPLTGLSKRDPFLHEATAAVALCRRCQLPAAVLVVALTDPTGRFAAMGREARKEIWRACAAVLVETAGGGAPCGHFDEEHLVLLLPGMTADHAQAFAQELATRIAEGVPHPAMRGERFRLRWGIATIGEGTERLALEAAIASAHSALAVASASSGPSEAPRMAAETRHQQPRSSA